MPKLRNTRTGWQGNVTPAMYERLIKKEQYVDPRGADPEDADVQQADPSPEDSSSGGYAVGEHKGAGYYYLLQEGEPVLDEEGEEKTVGRGPEAAQAEVDALNTNG